MRGEMSHSSRARVVLWLRWRAVRSADPRAGRSKGPTTAVDIPPATTSQACPPNPSRSPREVLHHQLVETKCRSKLHQCHGQQKSLPQTRRQKSHPPSATAIQSSTTGSTNTSNELATNNEIATNGSQPRHQVPIRRRATTGGHNSREPEGGRAQHQHIHQYQHQHQQYTRTCSTAIQIAFVASSA